MKGLENLSEEGFALLEDVAYRSITVDQLKITFHGIRYDGRRDVLSKSYIPPHMHNFFELHYLLTGFVSSTVSGIERIYGPGQYYLIPAKAIHSHNYSNELPDSYTGFAMRFEIAGIKRTESAPELDNIRSALEHAQASIIDDGYLLAREMNQIIETAKGNYSQCELLTLLSAIIIHVGHRYQSEYGTQKVVSGIPKGTEVILSQAVNFVQEHISEPITPSDVAAGIPISYSHLARLFSQHMKTSVSRYIVRVKIDTALHLLMTTDMEISEISQRTGFSSPSYFTHTFKDITGLSPRDYRKYWKEKRYFQGDSGIL